MIEMTLKRQIVAVTATMALVGGVAGWWSPWARAAGPTVTQDSLGPTSANVGTVTGTLTVHSSSCFTVQNLVIAVRDANGANLDFPNQFNKTICPNPAYNYTAQRNLSAGTYTIFGAYRYQNVWYNLPSKTLNVTQTDTQAPSVPTGLTAGTVTEDTVPLSWTASTDNVGVTGYEVFRNGASVGTPAGTSFTDTGLSAGTTYSYTVRARDAAGNWSAQSGAVNATTASPSGDPVPNGPGGTWVLKFNDDFNGTSVDSAKWSFISTAEGEISNNPVGTGNKGNQQLEFDQPSNCTVAGGQLTMRAKPDNITSQQGTHYDWSSCMINTSPSYSFRYGYIEERSKLPSIKGFWPALWTWGVAGSNIPGNGETDAYEIYTDRNFKVYQTQHNTGGGSCLVDYPLGGNSGDWHTYGVDIKPNGTDWYIDGVLTCSKTSTSGGLTNILVDNFVYSGGTVPDPSKQPAPGSVGDKIVDYVRAWER